MEKLKLFLNKDVKMKYLLIISGSILILVLIIMSGISSSAYKSLNSDYEELRTQYIDLRADSNFWVTLSDSQKETAKELISLTSSISDLQSEKTGLEADIKDLKADIKDLEADVIEVSGTAKRYPAGYLTAGEDFKIGRYKIYGGSSNFVVYSSSDALRVNIILGNDSYSVSEYIYEFSYGDKIRASSSFKMVPVK